MPTSNLESLFPPAATGTFANLLHNFAVSLDASLNTINSRLDTLDADLAEPDGGGTVGSSLATTTYKGMTVFQNMPPGSGADILQDNWKYTADQLETLGSPSYLPLAGGTITGRLVLVDAGNARGLYVRDGNGANIFVTHGPNGAIFADRGVFLTDGSGNVTATSFSGSGASLTSIPESAVTNLTTDLAAKLVKASNLSDLASASTARTNLGLGSLATVSSLTGPITSTGAATAIASQTGTGTTFVMSASPTITGTLSASILSAPAGTSGNPLSILASTAATGLGAGQDVTITGGQANTDAVTGGNVNIIGGLNNGGASAGGGNIIIKGGVSSGSLGNGSVKLQTAAGVTKLQVNSTGVGFFATTPVAQQTGDLVTALSNLGLVTSGTVALAAAATTLQTARNICGQSFNGSASITITEDISFIVDGAGAVLTTGSKGFRQVDFACTITGWTILGDQSGSVQLDIKKSTYSGFPTTSSIVASAPPAVSSAQKNTSTTLTGWTTSISAGDVLEFSVTSVTTMTRATIQLQVTR